MVHTYTFPDAVLSHTQNFVNDIVIDPANGMAYMSDTGISSTGHSGGIVVYDYKAVCILGLNVSIGDGNFIALG